MRLPPFAKGVVAGRRAPGHKLLVFAGPKAWNAARWFLGSAEPAGARAGYVLALPPEHTATPEIYRWPVRGCGVIVVSSLANDAELLPLFDSLQRDGARSIELYACDPSIGAGNLEWDLDCCRWGHPFADPLLAPARAAVAA